MGPRRVTIALVAMLLIAAASAAGGCAQEPTEVTPSQEGLEVGTAAPDFRLKNQDQNTVVLSDYLGSKNVILVFYPMAFTPV